MQGEVHGTNTERTWADDFVRDFICWFFVAHWLFRRLQRVISLSSRSQPLHKGAHLLSNNTTCVDDVMRLLAHAEDEYGD